MRGVFNIISRAFIAFALLISVVNASSVNYNLKKGWNAVTIPINVNQNFISLMGSIPHLNKIFGKNSSGNWISYTPGGASFLNKLKNFEGGKVYYIKLSDDSSFTLDGSSYSNKILNFTSGWNSFGVFDENITVETFLSKIDSSKVEKIFGKSSSGNWISYTPGGASFLNKLKKLIPTNVYYIKVKNGQSFSINLETYVLEARQVVSQDRVNSYRLKVKKLSDAPYNNGSFQTNTTPPEDIKPITITDNASWGVNIPGVYAGEIVKLSINNGEFHKINLINIGAGDTKVVSFTVDNNSTGGGNNTDQNGTSGDNNSTNGGSDNNSSNGNGDNNQTNGNWNPDNNSTGGGNNTDQNGTSGGNGEDNNILIALNDVINNNTGDNSTPINADVLANDTLNGNNIELYLLNGYDNNGNPNLSKMSDDYRGTWRVESNNTITFIPNYGFNGGKIWHNYYIKDENGHSSNATITLSYPVKLNTEFDSMDKKHIESANIDILSNDTITDINKISVYLIVYNHDGPQYVKTVTNDQGTWKLENNNSVTFTPSNDFTGGEVYLEYIVKDDNNNSSQSGINIMYPLNSSPICSTTNLTDVEEVFNAVKENIVYYKDNNHEINFNDGLDNNKYTIDSSVYTSSQAVDVLNNINIVKYSRRDYDSPYYTMEHNFSKEKLSYVTLDLNNGNWSYNEVKLVNDAGYKYKRTKSGSGTYQKQQDNSYIYKIDNHNISNMKFVKTLNSTELETLLQENNITINLDSNDTATLVLEKEPQNNIDWWYNNQEFNNGTYSSFSEFIKEYSYDQNTTDYNYNRLLNHNQSWQRKILFAHNSYNNNAGNLVEVDDHSNEILSNNAGRWEVKQLTEDNNTYNILVVKPRLCGYHERVFKLDGNKIIKGSFNTKANQITTQLVFSDTLAQKIKNAIISVAKNDLHEEPLSQKFTESILSNKKFYQVEEDQENKTKFYIIIEFKNGEMSLTFYHKYLNQPIVKEDSYSEYYTIDKNGMLQFSYNGRVALISKNNNTWNIVHFHDSKNYAYNDSWSLIRPSDLSNDGNSTDGNNSGSDNNGTCQNINPITGQCEDSNGTNGQGDQNNTDIYFEQASNATEYNAVNALAIDTTKTYYGLEYSNNQLNVKKYSFNTANNTVTKYRYNSSTSSFENDGTVNYTVTNNIFTITTPEGTMNIKYAGEVDATDYDDSNSIFQSGDKAYGFYAQKNQEYIKYLWFDENSKAHFLSYISSQGNGTSCQNINPITGECED